MKGFGIFIMVCWSISLTGQAINRGNFSVGGNITGVTEKYKEDGRTNYLLNFGIAPEYFVANRLSVGLEGGILLEKNQETGKVTYFNGGLYAKYFIFSPLIFAKIGYYQDNRNGKKLQLSLGMAFFANERFSVDPFVEFAKDLNSDMDDDIIRVGLGFRYYLTNKK